MVRTVPVNGGPGLVEVGPEACPDCGAKPMRPYHTGCNGTTGPGPGHRFWVCPNPKCDLWLIDADCDCDTPGRRWP